MNEWLAALLKQFENDAEKTEALKTLLNGVDLDTPFNAIRDRAVTQGVATNKEKLDKQYQEQYQERFNTDFEKMFGDEVKKRYPSLAEPTGEQKELLELKEQFEREKNNNHIYRMKEVIHGIMPNVPSFYDVTHLVGKDEQETKANVEKFKESVEAYNKGIYETAEKDVSAKYNVKLSSGGGGNTQDLSTPQGRAGSLAGKVAQNK